jgi:hypothetical protein
MKNQVAGSPINATSSLVVVQDSASNPLLMSIGNDNRAYLIARDQSAPSGYLNHDVLALDDKMKDFDKVSAVEMLQDTQGRISMAFAASKKVKEGEKPSSTLFVAPHLMNKMDDFSAWGKHLVERMVPVTGLEDGFTVSNIMINGSTSASSPAVIAAGSIPGGKYFMFFIICCC